MTFNKDAAPIIYRRCTSCHCPQGSAPFALATYRDAARRAAQIVQVTGDRFMPPWKPVPGYGDFAGAQYLTEAEIEILRRWSAQGAREGRPQGERPPLPQPSGWQLGVPDKILTMPRACAIPAEGMEVTRCFVLSVKLPAGTWIRAAEFRPQNRRVVRSAQIYLDNTHLPRLLQQQSLSVGYTSMGGPGFLPTNTESEWSPGALPDFFIPGVGVALQSETDLVLVTHFHPTGKPETEQSSVGLYLSRTPPQRDLAVIALSTNRIFIRPGEKDYRLHESFTVPVPVDLYGMVPHAHYLCTQIRCVANLPTGTRQTLLWIKDWDYDWQRSYRLLHPLRLPAGTVISAEFVYNNSDENLRNPSHPPKFVMWGAQTMDEMAGLWLQVVPTCHSDSEELVRLLTARARELATSAHRIKRERP